MSHLFKINEHESMYCYYCAIHANYVFKSECYYGPHKHKFSEKDYGYCLKCKKHFANVSVEIRDGMVFVAYKNIVSSSGKYMSKPMADDAFFFLMYGCPYTDEDFEVKEILE